MPTPTVAPATTFDDSVAAEAVEKAMRSGERQRVIGILAHACNAQRQMIRTPYKVRYGKDLEEELKKSLKADSEDLAVALMQTPTKLDVLELHRAVKGLGTNEKLLTEILSTKSNEEMEAIRNVYKSAYGKSLEEAVAADTSGDFKRLLLILIQGKRDEIDHIDSYTAGQEAHNMLKSLEKKSGIDKFDAFKCLATASPGHILRVASEVERLYSNSLEKLIEKEFSGDYKHLLQTLLHVAHGKPKYFADQIHSATKGLGTRDKDLIRIIVGRSEVDLHDIASEYDQKYKKKLTDLIREECKGPYMEGLLAIISGNKQF